MNNSIKHTSGWHATVGDSAFRLSLSPEGTAFIGKIRLDIESEMAETPFEGYSIRKSPGVDGEIVVSERGGRFHRFRFMPDGWVRSLELVSPDDGAGENEIVDVTVNGGKPAMPDADAVGSIPVLEAEPESCRFDARTAAYRILLHAPEDQNRFFSVLYDAMQRNMPAAVQMGRSRFAAENAKGTTLSGFEVADLKLYSMRMAKISTERVGKSLLVSVIVSRSFSTEWDWSQCKPDLEDYWTVYEYDWREHPIKALISHLVFAACCPVTVPYSALFGIFDKDKRSYFWRMLSALPSKPQYLLLFYRLVDLNNWRWIRPCYLKIQRSYHPEIRRKALLGTLHSHWCKTQEVWVQGSGQPGSYTGYSRVNALVPHDNDRSKMKAQIPLEPEEGMRLDQLFQIACDSVNEAAALLGLKADQVKEEKR